MKETHKKILGFAGLGLVAAITTVAAGIPAPTAGAVGVTDQVTVNVTSAVSPEVKITSSHSSEVTSPDYNFSVSYNNVVKVEVRLLKTGSSSEGVLLWSSDVSTEYATRDFSLNLDNYGGYGDYQISAVATSEDGVPVNSALSFKYSQTPTPTPTPTPNPGEDPEVPLDPPEEKVAKTIVEVKDADGNVVKTVEIANPSEVEKIDLSDLSNGTYTLVITGYDANGKVISQDTKTVVVRKNKEIIEIKDQGEEIGQVIITVTDEEGNVVKTITVDNPQPGQKVEVDLSDLPEGNYKINVEYRNLNGDIIGGETVPTTTNDDVSITIEEQEKEIGQVVITVVDKEGNTVKTIVLDNPSAGDVANVDLSDLAPGSYDIIVDYFDENGNKINSKTISVVKTDTNGNADVTIEDKVDSVTTIEITIYDKDGNVVRVVKIDRETGTVYVYDADGNLLYTIPNGYSGDGNFSIPFDGLEDGEYKTVITYKDANGKIIGNSTTYNITYDDGKAIVVPDTGGLFQGLNISREDYLITGLVVFMVISVVAFGIVIRKKKTNKLANKKNRR